MVGHGGTFSQPGADKGQKMMSQQCVSLLGQCYGVMSFPLWGHGQKRANKSGHSLALLRTLRQKPFFLGHLTPAQCPLVGNAEGVFVWVAECLAPLDKFKGIICSYISPYSYLSYYRSRVL